MTRPTNKFVMFVCIFRWRLPSFPSAKALEIIATSTTMKRNLYASPQQRNVPRSLPTSEQARKRTWHYTALTAGSGPGDRLHLWRPEGTAWTACQWYLVCVYIWNPQRHTLPPMEPNLPVANAKKWQGLRVTAATLQTVQYASSRGILGYMETNSSWFCIIYLGYWRVGQYCHSYCKGGLGGNLIVWQALVRLTSSWLMQSEGLYSSWLGLLNGW